MTTSQINMSDVKVAMDLANGKDFTAKSLIVSRQYMASLEKATSLVREKIMGMEVIVSDFMPPDTFMLVNKDILFHPADLPEPVFSSVLKDDRIQFRVIGCMPMPICPSGSVVLNTFYDGSEITPTKDDGWRFVYLFPIGKRAYVRYRRN